MANACEPRWCRITPGRLVVVLLALEGLLFASERLGLFGVNRHKGYTVLIALAMVGLAIVLMLLWFLAALLLRVWFQFGIRSLFADRGCRHSVRLAGRGDEASKAGTRHAVRELKKAFYGVTYDYQVDPLYYDGNLDARRLRRAGSGSCSARISLRTSNTPSPRSIKR